MIDSFYIAWKYLLFSKARSATLVACITLIAVLPLALEIILDESEHQLVERVQRVPVDKPKQTGGVPNRRLPNRARLLVAGDFELQPGAAWHRHLRSQTQQVIGFKPLHAPEV